jgi:hypothetical protein
LGVNKVVDGLVKLRGKELYGSQVQLVCVENLDVSVAVIDTFR